MLNTMTKTNVVLIGMIGSVLTDQAPPEHVCNYGMVWNEASSLCQRVCDSDAAMKSSCTVTQPKCECPDGFVVIYAFEGLEYVCISEEECKLIEADRQKQRDVTTTTTAVPTTGDDDTKDKGKSEDNEDKDKDKNKNSNNNNKNKNDEVSTDSPDGLTGTDSKCLDTDVSDADPLTHFGEPSAAMVGKRWSQLLFHTRESTTVSECAKACIAAGERCRAFQYHAKKNRKHDKDSLKDSDSETVMCALMGTLAESDKRKVKAHRKWRMYMKEVVCEITDRCVGPDHTQFDTIAMMEMKGARTIKLSKHAQRQLNTKGLCATACLRYGSECIGFEYTAASRSSSETLTSKWKRKTQCQLKRRNKKGRGNNNNKDKQIKFKSSKQWDAWVRSDESFNCEPVTTTTTTTTTSVAPTTTTVAPTTTANADDAVADAQVHVPTTTTPGPKRTTTHQPSTTTHQPITTNNQPTTNSQPTTTNQPTTTEAPTSNNGEQNNDNNNNNNNNKNKNKNNKDN